MNNIRINKLTKTYDNKRYLFKNANLVFEEGCVYAILGKSGCGKTTLLNILSGADKEYEGDVFYNECNIKDIEQLDKRFYKSSLISYIHSGPVCFNKLDVASNLSIPFLLSPLNINKEELKQNGVPVNKITSKLSGGEQKRINILQGISKESMIILADEPTANLDNDNAEMYMQKLIESTKEKIFIFVTHDKKIANKYADQIIEIKNGKIDKNYKKKLISNTLEDKKVSKISIQKSKTSAKKFHISEKNQSKRLLNSCVVMLTTTSIAASIVFGLKEYISNQINSASTSTYIYLENNISLENTTDEDLTELNNDFKDTFFISYLDSNNLVADLNDSEITIPSSSFSKPFKSSDELEDGELYFEINEDYKTYLENVLECEDIEDYMLDNSLIISFSIKNDNYEFLVKDLFFSEDDSYLTICSSSAEEYLNFNDGKTSTICFENNNDGIKQYFYESNIYFYQSANNINYVYKTNEDYVSLEKISNITKNIIPICNVNENWIWFFNNILYFNNCEFSHNYDILENTVFYSPFIDNLLIGRMPENNNEIVISTGLYNAYNFNGTGEEISIKFNNITNNYKVVGVIKEDNCYIYQDASFAYNSLIENYCISKYDLKANSFFIFEQPSTIENLTNQLSTIFPSLILTSPLYETVSTIDSLCSNISFIAVFLVLFLIVITILSMIILSKTEIINYSKQIALLKQNGLIEEDLNSIYKKIINKRFLYCAITSSISSFILVNISNVTISNLEIFGDNFLSNNILVYTLIILLCFVSYSVTYLCCKFKQTKTPVIKPE